MTVEVDRRYADAKARIRRSDREELVTQFRSAYGDRAEAVLAALTGSGPSPSRSRTTVRRRRKPAAAAAD